MQLSRPLPDTHPEFIVLEGYGFREYRVENWRLIRDGSGRVLYGTSGLTWMEAFSPLILSTLLPKSVGVFVKTASLVLLIACVLWFKCTQVLHETVIVIPPHGIQLETHHGVPPLRVTVYVSRRFIPLIATSDMIINEGFHRWSVRYYLTVLKRAGTGALALEAAFPNILPPFPVLTIVHYGIHDILLSHKALANQGTRVE